MKQAELIRVLLGLLHREYGIEPVPSELTALLQHRVRAQSNDSSPPTILPLLQQIVSDKMVRYDWALNYIDHFFAETVHRAEIRVDALACELPTIRLAINLHDAYIGWPTRVWTILASDRDGLRRAILHAHDMEPMPTRLLQVVDDFISALPASSK